VKVLSTTEGSDDTAAGLLVLCALVCGLIMFRFYMQIGQTPRLGSAAAHWSTSAEVKTHRSLVRASNRVSEIPATKYGYSREAAEEITRRGSQIVKSAHSASFARAASFYEKCLPWIRRSILNLSRVQFSFRFFLSKLVHPAGNWSLADGLSRTLIPRGLKGDHQHELGSRASVPPKDRT
jgi:hypothetical protein